MTANYKTFGGNPHESAEQEPEPEQQSEQSESEQQPESEPESEQPEQPLNTKNGHATACPFFSVSIRTNWDLSCRVHLGSPSGGAVKNL